MPSTPLSTPQLIYQKEVDSTNRYLSQLASSGELPHLYTLWADFQTAGRGQRDNHWESQAGKNLTFSILLYPQGVVASHHFLLSQSIAIAIQKVLSTYVAGITIKWPNDIYHHDSKICGVLIENNLQGSWIEQTIAGIGINVNQLCFHSNAPNPVSLAQLLGEEVDRERLLKEVVSQIAQSPLWRGEIASSAVDRFSFEASTVESSVLESSVLESSFLESSVAESSVMESSSVASSGIVTSFSSQWVEELQAEYRSLQYRASGFHPFRDAHGPFRAQLVQILPSGELQLQDESGLLRSYGFKEVAYLQE